MACSQGPYVMLTSERTDSTCVRLQQTTHLYPWVPLTHNACLMCKRETHFLLVFFAFALFFLAWSARTVRRKEWAVNYFAIVWVLVCCLTLETIKKGWHCLRGRIPHPTYSSEARAVCGDLYHVINIWITTAAHLSVWYGDLTLELPPRQPFF